MPTNRYIGALGTLSLHLSAEGPDSVFLVSPTIPKTEAGIDEVDLPTVNPPIAQMDNPEDITDWRNESLSIFSPVRAEALQRVPPPKGSSGTWYQIGTKMIRETPTPLRTKCSCSQYKNKGWCPCKESECRAYRKAKGIPVWNGLWESPRDDSFYW